MKRRIFLKSGVATAISFALSGCVTTGVNSQLQGVIDNLTQSAGGKNILKGGRIGNNQFLAASQQAEGIFAKYGQPLPKADISALVSMQKAQIGKWQKARQVVMAELR